eukprot:m.179299 g.179299  ORF g.179299 m.179299 type:complete len:55 (+) comp39215_c1_seq6:1121-1285(+)
MSATLDSLLLDSAFFHFHVCCRAKARWPTDGQQLCLTPQNHPRTTTGAYFTLVS